MRRVGYGNGDSKVSLKHTKESKRRISSFYIQSHMKNKQRIYYNIITSTQKISMAIIKKLWLSRRTLGRSPSFSAFFLPRPPRQNSHSELPFLPLSSPLFLSSSASLSTCFPVPSPSHLAAPCSPLERGQRNSKKIIIIPPQKAPLLGWGSTMLFFNVWFSY